MPDITKAQVLAVVKFLVAQVVAWGFIQNDAGQKIIAIAGIVIPAVWIAADAYLRGERVKAVSPPPTLDTSKAS